MKAADHPLGFAPHQFWDRVLRTDAGCWHWTGAHSVGGYGQLALRNANGRVATKGAHRMAWELLVGPIPEGMEIDHRCRNRGCVNPAHLRVVTRAENIRDAAQAGRRPVDPATWAAEVRALLDATQMSQIELAHALGVQECTVSTWVSGRRAAHASTRERLRQLATAADLEGAA